MEFRAKLQTVAKKLWSTKDGKEENVLMTQEKSPWKANFTTKPKKLKLLLLEFTKSRLEQKLWTCSSRKRKKSRWSSRRGKGKKSLMSQEKSARKANFTTKS